MSKQVCCNCIVLPVSCPPHPPLKSLSLYKGKKIKQKVLELPCESIFLIKACEGQPLKRVEKNLEKYEQLYFYEIQIKWNNTCWCRFHENSLIIVHNMQYISSFGYIIFTRSDFALAVALLRCTVHQLSRKFIVRRNTRYTDIWEHVGFKCFCVLYKVELIYS